MIRKTLLPLMLIGLLAANEQAYAGVVYQSAELGEVGISREDVGSLNVPGARLGVSTFLGVRFELPKPALIHQVGGHLVGPLSSGDRVFSVLVRLDGISDFPNSEDLSSSDVVGAVAITVQDESSDVFGDLEAELDPGWYALVFGGGFQGQGLFSESGLSAAVANNRPLGEASFIERGQSGWFDSFPLDPDLPKPMVDLRRVRFAILGTIVPEPLALHLVVVACAALATLMQGRRDRDYSDGQRLIRGG